VSHSFFIIKQPSLTLNAFYDTDIIYKFLLQKIRETSWVTLISV